MKRRSSWLLLSLIPILLLLLSLPIVAVSCSSSSASGKPTPKIADLAAPAPSFKSIDDRLQAVEKYVAGAASFQTSQTLANRQITADITVIKADVSAIKLQLQRIEAKLK